MLAFLGGALLGKAVQPPLVAPLAARVPVATGVPQQEAPEAPGIGLGSLEVVVTAIASCGVAGLVRQRRRSTRRSRVIMGPANFLTERYVYKSKPGDKYRWKFSSDWDIPEFGCQPEGKGRLLEYGVVWRRGKKMGRERWLRIKAMKEERRKQQEVKGDEAVGALLVDCDGTIVETERDGHRVAFNKAFKEKGYDFEWDVDLYGELLTTGGGKERMTRYFTDINAEAWKQEDPPSPEHPEIVELHKLKTKLFMEIVRSGELELREGILELLEEAAASKWSIAVCSTSNEESVKAVVETYLPELADQIKIFAGDMVSKKKPDPEIYTMAAAELGMPPMKCVVIEDTNIGLQAGKAAGMDVIITKSIYSADEDFEDADLVLESAEEIDFEEDIAAVLEDVEIM